MVDAVPELLSPAGGPAEFNAALAAGADAIYCGFGTTFNARRGAQSFTSQTFEEACRRAHVAGVRVYVTVNVAIRDDEMPTVLALVRQAWLKGADAFIIQDWGLMREIRRRWPQIECHVSTQANVHDARGVAWCRELGVCRVTLSRELSVAEIARIAEEGVDLECFCHGAICICYSGVCQMSSCAGNRSANRGACAQPCRLPYELVDDKGRVLSSPDRGRPLCPRDFYSFDDVERLARAGVASLKVEGRLKGPDYIVSVISAYRAQLDDLARGTTCSEEELQARRTRLKRAFNRDFTNAYLMGTADDELMSYERSNNRGELVGTVVDSASFGSMKVRRGGRGGGRERLRTIQVAQTDVLLDKPVDKGDLLEIRPVSDPSQFLTAHVPEDAAAHTIIICKTTRAMEKGSVVRVIRSQKALDWGGRVAEADNVRKRAVNVRIRARLGEPFEVELQTVDGACAARVAGFVAEAARSRAVSREDLIEHVGRMGSTPFEPVRFEVELDEGCGMGFSAVHKVRAQACDELERELSAFVEARTLDKAPSRERIHADLGMSQASVSDRVEICAWVSSPRAAQRAYEAGATRVYADASHLGAGTWPQGVIPSLDEVCREKDHERLDAYVVPEGLVAVGNVSQLAYARQSGARPEIRSCIPVHNLSCVRALEEAGAQAVWLSPELSLEEIQTLAAGSGIDTGVLVYGRPRAMTCEHCVLQVADACCHDCARCGLRRNNTFLRNGEGELFPVRTDEQGRSRVYSSRCTDLIPDVPALMDANVRRLAIDGTLLSPEQVARAVRRASDAVRAWQAGAPMPQRLEGCTSGHLFSPLA